MGRVLGSTRARDLFNSIAGSALVPNSIRWRVLRAWGMDVAPSMIAGGCWFGDTNVHIGAGSFVNYRCFFDCTSPITIGANCDIAMSVTFVTTDHEMGDRDHRGAGDVSAPIVLEDGCWIGAAAVILAGVTVGAGAVVAAGSVVVHDVPPDTLVGGVPARSIRALPV